MSANIPINRRVAFLLVSVLLIYGSFPAMFLSVANAAATETKANTPVDAVPMAPKVDDAAEPAMPRDDNAGKQEEDLLKLIMNMKVMQKDMEDVLLNDKNRVRFFDPEVNKGLIDEDMLNRLLMMQEGLLDEFDRIMAEEGAKAPEDVEVPEVEEEEPPVVKDLDDEQLMKLALDMKVMEKDLEKYTVSDSTNWTIFRPAFNAGLINRPFLGRMVCLRRTFLGAFGNPFARINPLCPLFPRPPFFRPPFFRPPVVGGVPFPFPRPPQFGVDILG